MQSVARRPFVDYKKKPFSLKLLPVGRPRKYGSGSEASGFGWDLVLLQSQRLQEKTITALINHYHPLVQMLR